MMNHKIQLIIFSIVVGLSHSDNVGWTKQFEENEQEFHNIPLKWEMGESSSIPSWLSGVYVRNGPAKIKFGDGKHVSSSWLDGFAKLHSFKFSGKEVFYSGKMVESTTYMDSKKKEELVPQITLGAFQNPDDDWGMFEMMEIFDRSNEQFNGNMEHNSFDNFNPATWRMGSVDDPIYLAVTDFPFVLQYDINTLDTVRLMKPKFGQQTSSGVAHWQREVGTENSIYPMGKVGGFFHPNSIEFQRFTPDMTNFSSPEVIAQFDLKKVSMVHSFSITENYAIYLAPPVVMGGGVRCLLSNRFHIFECIEENDEQTDVYIVNLKTGEVKEMSGDILFSMHHINAYETKDGKQILLDLSPTNELSIKTYPLLENMLNPSENSTSWDTSTCGAHEVTRYTFDLETGLVSSSTFDNLLQGSSLARFVNKFDMAVINELYRGREYCVIYGWSSFDYSRNALVKKNVCDSSKDKVLYWENHYPTEMYFLADPEGSEEDDGVLVSVSFDGELEKNYLLLLDAKDFKEIDRAYLPINIPYPLSHGMHFPDAKWTL